MSVAPSHPATAETSLTSPPAKLTFAERFYFLATVANGLLVIMFLAYTPSFTTPWGRPPSQISFAWSLAIVMVTLVAGWGTLIGSRTVPLSWAGLAAPLISLAPAVRFACWIDSDNYFLRARFLDGSRGILAAYFLVFGLLWIWGVRLLSPSALAGTWSRGKLSLRMLVPLFLFGIAYSQAARDLEMEGPLSRVLFGWLDETGAFEPGLVHRDQFGMIAITSVVAIGAFIASLTSYVGWLLTIVAGVVLHVVSSRTAISTPWFTFDDNKHAFHFLGTIMLLTAGMTLPWVLLGWRIVWTPPLWERSWRNPKVASGEVT